ncbi:MAG: 1-acyl-sn-glycerol-3-phosphate acyltransferase [Stutzerimonas stutzeri]|uniref:Lysophospholipid acyltransferase family protein n=1 Tax=Bosea eneae TaxID=151454 RepID=A0ABW0IUA9_9HYPH|nr:MAG: 1-acyl-sn-glycerol-3-phosphate acyltransferase [Stutzerimonas stutzeri]
MKGLRPGAMARLALLVLGTLVLIPPQLVAMRFGRPFYFTRLFQKLVCRSFGVRITARGEAPRRGEGGLIVANHISWLDIPVIGTTGPLSFVAKAEVATWPVIGWLSTLQRTVFIDRMRRGATAGVASEMGKRLQNGQSVVLFAEGTTGDGTRIVPLRSSLLGAAHEAVRGADESETTVYPLCITYTGFHGLRGGRAERSALAWYGDTELAPHLQAMINSGAIDVELAWGEPIRMGRKLSRKEATRLAEISIRRARQEAVTGRSRG